MDALAQGAPQHARQRVLDGSFSNGFWVLQK
jgi:hypothetical protein